MIDLRKVREEKKMTQEQLAKETGVIRQTIGEIECGRNKPSVPLAKKIGEILEIDWTGFFDD